MTRRSGALVGALLTLFGCRARPANETSAALGTLVFPVVVIHDGTSLVVHRSVEDLLVMGTQRVLSRRDDPVLVDAAFRVYVLGNLRSTKSGGSLMLGAGTGRTPVAFELRARPELSGLEPARGLIVACKYLSTGDADAVYSKGTAAFPLSR